MINEERHYPKFLDYLKNKICNEIIAQISKHISNGVFSFKKILNANSEYCDNILFNININPNGDINDDKSYNAYYYNMYNNLYNGKLYSPIIMVNCPYSNGKTNYDIIKTCISHELTHLYDDWNSLKNGNESITRQDINIDSTNLLKELMDSTSEFKRGIGGLVYLSFKTEQNAFLSQTVQELEGLGCNHNNYKETIKKTILYRNITKSYRMFYNGIKNTNETTLFEFNKLICSKFPKSNIPKYPLNSFNLNIYKNKLSKWAEKIYYKIIKNYGYVVSFYLDELNETWNRNNCFLTL